MASSATCKPVSSSLARRRRPAMEDVMDKPTTSPISTRKHGDVLIILSNNPPVNALSTPVRQGLVDAIAQAEADDSVKAVVIACEGQTFFAGADITEFGKPPVMPWLPQVVDRIEACTKPVVAAIHGTALGGGLEVALACHYRVAVPSAKLGTPEVKLGLLPGAGGTQRLPRVAGVRKALEMCATGNPIGAKEGFDCGLIDRLIEGELLPHAVGYAEEVRDVRPFQKSSERQEKLNECNPETFETFLKENRRKFRRARGQLSATRACGGLAGCDFIIAAVYENMDVKKDVFGRLDKIAKPGAILASNTSYLDINEIAASISRPGDVVGMHFFSPANVMKLLEVVRGDKTAPDVLLTVMGLGKKIRKVPVVAGVCHGFIGNRMLMPRQIEATKLLLEGATPEQVDRVHVEFGMPMGPFQMADLAGSDIGWHRDPTRIENIRDALCAIDRWGQKKGAGFYDYDEKRRPSPSPKVQEIIEDFRQKEGVTPRDISDQEIIERTLYTMVNEGAKILEESIAQRASDIDVVWVYGYGWPVYRGGPMFWADTEGAAKIVEGLKRQEERMKPEFSFSKLLLDKADRGEKFTR